MKCVVSSSSRRWTKLPFLLLVLSAGVSQTAHAQGTGYWHTSGNQILDSNNQEVRIAGINWYGFETTDQVVHGLWSQDYHTILKAIGNNGYNVIRLPYSNQMVEAPVVPSTISFSNGSGPINTDLKGLTSLEVMDKVISAAGSLGLRVILDNHRSEAGNSAEASGLWHTPAYPESAWIYDWQKLVTRYAGYRDGNGDPIVIGADVRNEPHLSIYGSLTGSCWTGDSSVSGCPTSNTAQNWSAAAERAGNAILSANPNLLIIIEGVDCYSRDCDWWGGNLEGVASHPLTLSVSGHLVYSAHDYGPNLFQQSWFNSATSFSSLSSVWHKFWEFVSADNIAPVMVGEFGTGNSASDIESSAAGSQGQWFESLVTYLKDNPRLSWTYWALNGEDSYGLLDNQYDSSAASSLKQDQLALIQFPLGGGDGGSVCKSVPPAPKELTASAVSSSEINLSWKPVTPPAGCNVAYNVYRSTTSGFSASSSTQIASGLVSTSFANSGLKPQTTYYYKVTAVDAKGVSLASAQASAKTRSGSGSSSCHVIYTIVNQWNDGFQAAITINNTSNVALTHWALQWTFPGNQKIAGLWNASYSQSGATVTANSLSYNGTIPAGGSYNGVGFTANFSESNGSPTNFSLNGSLCN